jgi:peptidoglycan/LPS O-acetylase OafA/YrhL
VIFALVLVLLVVLLLGLISSINHGEHLAPQAYYRRKRGGAPIAFGYEALVPRRRRRLEQDTADELPGPDS